MRPALRLAAVLCSAALAIGIVATWVHSYGRVEGYEWNWAWPDGGGLRQRILNVRSSDGVAYIGRSVRLENASPHRDGMTSITTSWTAQSRSRSTRSGSERAGSIT